MNGFFKIPLITQNFGVTLDWLGTAIQWLIGIGPIVGVGIILFTIILKTVVLPLDAFSKVKMRKNNLKMEKMRPQLEKLQKQYANDKQAYNAKMMELYKKNGYSMLGPCLPMIVTLVIFIFVMGAFANYSEYTNIHTYEQMAESYNAAILQYSEYGTELPSGEEVPKTGSWEGSEDNQGNILYTISKEYDGDENCLIRLTLIYTYEPIDEEESSLLVSMEEEERNNYLFSKFDSYVPSHLNDKNGENATKKGVIIDNFNIEQSFKIKSNAVLTALSEENGQNELFAPLRAAAENVQTDGEIDTEEEFQEVIKQLGRDAASNTYYDVKDSFLWVGNIWLSDVSYAHPVTMPEKVTGDFDINDFNELTYNLSAEKAAPNGYFILIILSIGFMFLSQFILSRSQKAQNELQTADGRGKKTQKVMMIVMPVIYGIFAFFYSAAFTIYMITSSVYNVVSTLIINAIIDRRFRKREEQEIQDKYNKRLPQHAASGAVSKASAGTNNRQSVNKQLRQNKLRISEKEKKSADTNREKRNGGK